VVRPQSSPDGFLLIDKPAGLTSHDVVDRVRRIFGIRRVGHGGTLDPLATGLLILMLGSSTRKASDFLDAEKTYLATLRLGTMTDTQDAQGKILESRPVGSFTREQIQAVCGEFLGAIPQQIPAYSAVRIGGVRSYALARAGREIPPRTRNVEVRELEILRIDLPDVEFRVTCSKGTYVRTLCADIGRQLGCGGHLRQLRRIRIGSITVDRAVRLDGVSAGDILPCIP